MIGASQPYTTTAYTAYIAHADDAGAPTAVPTITYSVAGNSQQNDDASAIGYCAMLGKSPVLRDEEGSNRTYECRYR